MFTRQSRAALIGTKFLSIRVEVNSQNIDLAREDLAVLHAIRDANRPVTTSTLREQMHWADSGSQVRYRLDKLEERGLITTEYDDDRTKDHEMAARVATTTDAGDAIAQEHDDDPETLPVEERLKRLEKQVEQIGSTHAKIKNRIVELEDDVDAHDNELADLDERLGRIINLLEDADTGGDLR